MNSRLAQAFQRSIDRREFICWGLCYIYLTSMQAKLIADLKALDRYLFCGHGAVSRNSETVGRLQLIG